ncbi:hypothetical protein GGR57DRAFT_498183 [Xylariaceae sp. FL1272]|nr:hypothetical protein GGR57DRAFT_498183 [Xylariaceae sp. FL1272]
MSHQQTGSALGRCVAKLVHRDHEHTPKEWFEVYEHGKHRKIKYSDIVKDNLDEWHPYFSVMFGESFLSKGTEEIPIPLDRDPQAERVPLRIIKIGTWNDARHQDQIWRTLNHEMNAAMRWAFLFSHNSHAFYYIFVHAMWRLARAGNTDRVLDFENRLNAHFKDRVRGRVIFLFPRRLALDPGVVPHWNTGVWQPLNILRPSEFYRHIHHHHRHCQHNHARDSQNPHEDLSDDPPPPYSEFPKN